MAGLLPDRNRSLWRSTREAVVAVLRWSPRFSPATAKLVKWSAIGAFALDFGLLVALHNRWIDDGWRTVRTVDDNAALFLMILWMSHVFRRRRMKRADESQPLP